MGSSHIKSILSLFIIFFTWLNQSATFWSYFFNIIWTTKPVISSMDTFAAIANNMPLYMGQNYSFFYFMSKIIRILSKDHGLSIYLVHFLPEYHNSYQITKRNFWLVICIAKNLISNFLCIYLFVFFSFFFFAPSDSRFLNSCISAKYCGNTMESLFIQLSDAYIQRSHVI